MDRMTESRSLSVINAAISAPFVQSADCLSTAIKSEKERKSPGNGGNKFDHLIEIDILVLQDRHSGDTWTGMFAKDNHRQ